MRQHYIQFTHGAAALAARVYTAGQPPLIRSTTLSGADERHTSRCQKSFLRGIVYFDKRRSETAWAVRNLSEDGASIVLPQTITIPDLIELEIPQRKRTVIARVEWRRRGRAFVPQAGQVHNATRGSLIKRILELETEIATLQRTIRRLKRSGDGGIEAA